MTEPQTGDPLSGLPDVPDGWVRDILPKIGDGSFDDPFRPSLPPQAVHYAIQAEVGENGYVVDYSTEA